MAGALAGGLGGGGGASVSASSSASAGPQSGTTGSLILQFGGINLGNQDIPTTQTDSQSNNQPSTQGRTPLAALGGLTGESPAMNLTGYALIAGLALVAWWLFKHNK